MPKSTFHNLSDAKRTRFIDVALDEFGSQAFDSASLSVMVQRLGIAKGSVYQYFEHKLDLFGWLVEQALARREAFFGLHPVPQGLTFQKRLRWFARLHLDFWRSEPRWARILVRACESSREEGVAALRSMVIVRESAPIIALLVDAQSRGEVRADADLQVLAPIIRALLDRGVLDAYMARAGLQPDQLDISDDTADDALHVVDVAVSLVANGVHEEAALASK